MKELKIFGPQIEAISSILFAQNGVDLSGIVDDMCGSDDEKELMRLNVALAFNKKKASLPPIIYRVDKSYNNSTEPSIRAKVPVKMSFIRGQVFYYEALINSNGSVVEPKESDRKICSESFEYWRGHTFVEAKEKWLEAMKLYEEKASQQN